MSRPIKYRIYNPTENKMIISGSTPMMLHSFFKSTAKLNTQYGMPYEEYIGLKDKNVREIFGSIEINGQMSKGGDILQFENTSSWGYRRLVQFHKGAFGWFDLAKAFVIMGHPRGNQRNNKHFKKIGNQTDNPELLEGEADGTIPA